MTDITGKDGNSKDFNEDGVESIVKIGTLGNNDLKDFSFRSDYTFDVSPKSQIGFGLKATNYESVCQPHYARRYFGR